VPDFDSHGVRISYDVIGDGPPILLIHGFASNARVNWVSTGWTEYLSHAGYRVIIFDNRGHGDSAKLYDENLYGAQDMAEDARRLLDHLQIAEANVMGYSMGARITAFLAINHPERVCSAVIAGLAYNMVRGFGRGDMIAEALEAEDASTISEPEPAAFRKFAEQTRSDLKALAACMRSRGHKIGFDDLAKIRCPVLVVAGDADSVAGPIEPLLEVIPNSTGVYLPGKDHMKAVGDRQYKQAVLSFLNGLS